MSPTIGRSRKTTSQSIPGAVSRSPRRRIRERVVSCPSKTSSSAGLVTEHLQTFGRELEEHIFARFVNLIRVRHHIQSDIEVRMIDAVVICHVENFRVSFPDKREDKIVPRQV